MTKQRLHPNLGEIDVLTREEMQQELERSTDTAFKMRYLGLELQRIPEAPIIAGAATLQLYTQNDATPWGPEQGDIWMVRRVIVKSNVLTDTARYQVFRGSTPSDVSNMYTSRQLLEGFSPGSIATVVSSPAIGTSPSTYVNTNNTGVNVTVAGGTVSAIAVNGQTITGVISGTFFLAPGSYITVTYSVTPTTYTIVNATSTVPSGQTVNQGYYPGTKSVFLQPGEQIYAQIQGATVGNSYLLNGEAIRCPAPMKGKLLLQSLQ